jgi:HAD superfamily phosphatase (TIGR01668 family)
MPDAGRPSSNLLVPTIRVASVPEIHLETLRSLGIKGLIFDLDDTLVHAIEPRAHPEMMAWIEAIRAEFKIYIVSNNPRRDRVELAALHLDLPFHHAAKKPSRRFFRAALETMKLQPSEVAIVGDQLFTDVLGGNRLGAVTILVDPLSPERKWHRKVMRSVERFMLASQGTTYFTPAPRE